MTNKEAIEIIYKYDVNGCGYCHQGGDEIQEAFNMAISALKAQEQEVVNLTTKVAELATSQEPVRPDEIRHRGVHMYYQCPVCMSALRAVDRYCSQCGRRVQWE